MGIAVVKKVIGTIQLSLKGMIEFADLDFSRILKRPLEDIIGRSCLDFVEDVDRDAAEARLKVLIISKKMHVATKRYKSADYSLPPLPVLTYAGVLRDPGGYPTGLFSTNQPLSHEGFRRLRAEL